MAHGYSLKVYNGYGNRQNLFVFGYVVKKGYKNTQHYRKSLWPNLKYLIKLFLVKPVKGACVQLSLGGVAYTAVTDGSGYFKFDIDTPAGFGTGWGSVSVTLLSSAGLPLTAGQAEVYVPAPGEHIFVSDIDDTALLSHSATVVKRLVTLLTKNPRRRKLFPNTAEHYCKLAGHVQNGHDAHPFFYVSSSEWNLYDYLREVFSFNKMPRGVFLLNTLKTWRSFLQTGKTGHEGKLTRIYRVMDTYKSQRFVFFGDNSQKDPDIYTAIARRFPQRVKAIYIRNVRPSQYERTLQLLQPLEKLGVSICIFTSSAQTLEYSKTLGLAQ